MNGTDIPLGVNKSNYISYNALVVGYHKTEREHILRMLVRRDFAIVGSISTLVDAFKELEYLQVTDKKPDVMLADIESLGSSSLLYLEKIRETYPDLKILVFHIDSDKETIKKILDLKIHSFDLKPIDDKKLTRKLAKVLNREDLIPREAEILSEVKTINLKNFHIPTLPEVTFKVLRVNPNNPEIGWEELEKLIQPDKSIDANVIRLANSSSFGRSGKIHTLKDAIQLLGVQNVKNLVFLLTKKNIYGRVKGKLYHKFLQELPILSALIAVDLSVVLDLKDEKELIFLYSFLGRIGMVVMAMNFPDQYKEVLRFYEFGIKNLENSELTRFNSTSQSITIKVFKLWKMPESFMETVENKNFNYEEMPGVSNREKVIRLAEIFAMRLIGVTLDQSEEKIFNALLNYFKRPDLIDKFSTEYYDLVQDHPLYAISLG